MEGEVGGMSGGNHRNTMASGDENLKEILHNIRTSKTPAVINYGEMSGGNHGITIASGDENLKVIFHNIRTSKTPAVINYGASWCHVCSQILPAFSQLGKKFPKLSFIYADIDECPETTQHIRYTPTFHFYRDGERVDEMFGAGEERLHDRLWLHS